MDNTDDPKKFVYHSYPIAKPDEGSRMCDKDQGNVTKIVIDP